MKKILLLVLLNTIFSFSQSTENSKRVLLPQRALPRVSVIPNFENYNVVSKSNPNFIPNPACSSSVVPPTTLNGVNITDSFSGSVDIYPLELTSCGNITTPPNSRYLGANGSFVYTMNFSQPVNNLVIALTAAGYDFDEVFNFTTNTGNPTITTSSSCFSVISGNTIFSGLGSNPSNGFGGGGIFTITAPTNFTSLTISGPGGQAGSLLSLCSNSVNPVNCNAGFNSPILSANSISNLCNNNTVNLNTITSINTPNFNGVTLVWFTGNPVSSSNQLTNLQASAQAVGPTYYAAFYDSINNCYSPSSPVTTQLVSPNTVPNFDAVAPICSGDFINPLPTTSNNGISGTWSPPLNNLVTTQYTFVPNSGQCGTNTTTTIQVTPNVVPTFTPVSPIAYGGILNPLPTTSNNGVTGSWSPPLNNTATTEYTFTPDFGQCASQTTLIIQVNIIPSPQCTSSVVPPTTLNGVFITDNFSGSVLTYPTPFTSCGSVTTPENSIWLGSSGSFIYTLNFSVPVNNLVLALTAAGQQLNEEFIFTTNTEIPTITSPVSCYSVITGNTIFSGENGDDFGGGGGVFIINTITPFTSLTISGPGGQNGSLVSICSNSVIPVNCNAGTVAPILSATTISNLCNLNSVNLNTITSSNTPSSSGVSLVWFTGNPVSAANQLTFAQAGAQPIGPTYYAAFFDSINNCFSPVTSVTTQLVTPNIVPTFTPVSPICSGNTLNSLPTTSLNGISGTWSPALNNLATTIYNFTPNAGQCGVSTNITIQVNPVVNPTFSPVNPICSGTVLNPLPTTSLNGITGTWSPALNNVATTQYTFVPNSGQCGTNTNLTIQVNPNVIPAFSLINPICAGSVLNALPTTSTNGVVGTWSPALNNQLTTVYTFSPNSGQCSSNTNLTIHVNPIIIPTFTVTNSICSGTVLAPLPTTSSNGIIGSWSPGLNNLTTTQYTFLPNSGQCSTQIVKTITVNPVPDVAINFGCNGLDFVLTAVSDITSNVTYTWYNQSNVVIGNSQSVIITNSGNYQLVVSTLNCNGVANTSQTNVYCDIQKGISPGNDTLNEYFELSNLNVKKLQIYNRYGLEIYSKTNYKNEWNGKSNNGQELPDGTYYYVIDFESNKSRTGWIYINREY